MENRYRYIVRQMGFNYITWVVYDTILEANVEGCDYSTERQAQIKVDYLNNQDILKHGSIGLNKRRIKNG